VIRVKLGIIFDLEDGEAKEAVSRHQSASKLPAAMSAGANGARRAMALFSMSIFSIHSLRIVEY
jgi:hypothetical protein